MKKLTLVEYICSRYPEKVFDLLQANGYQVENGNFPALCAALYDFGQKSPENFKKALALHPDKEIICKTFGNANWEGDESAENPFEEKPTEKPIEKPAEVKPATDAMPFFKSTTGMIVGTAIVTIGIVYALSAILKK